MLSPTMKNVLTSGTDLINKSVSEGGLKKSNVKATYLKLR